MVGDVCDVDWLGEQLIRSAGCNSDEASTPLECGGGGVVVLDCRSPVDYQTSHILGAVHLAVPTLMLRRLTTGNLPVSSVISCLQVGCVAVIITDIVVGPTDYGLYCTSFLRGYVRVIWRHYRPILNRHWLTEYCNFLGPC